MLYLIRGLPGSGKSTMASHLRRSLPAKHFEADMYFIKNGKYIFDRKLLFAAHQWCLQETRKALESNFNVVVSNTFTTFKEIEPYVELAKELKVMFNVICMENTFQSVHNVPEETIERMRNRWESFI